MFCAKQTMFELIMHVSATKSLKPLNSKHSTLFQAYDYDLKFKPLIHNNIYQIVFCAMFRAKQTKFELLYA